MCSSFERSIDTYTFPTGVTMQLSAKALFRPSDMVDAICLDSEKEMVLCSYPWGLTTDWSSRPLINARVETVESKSTFSKAFKHRRCCIPMTNWHEWRDEGAPRKQKYNFSYQHRKIFLMAGIWYPPTEHHPNGALVTLTCDASPKAAVYHDRMPLLIRDADAYLTESFDWQKAVRELHLGDERLVVTAV